MTDVMLIVDRRHIYDEERRGSSLHENVLNLCHLPLTNSHHNHTMCDWLAYGDWCDVLLICGGRSFNAHRAVLASVSNFLRRLLLSCPVDESPVVIFLPEFDLDVMPAVLYYIYNGEVLLPTNKLKMFLDTAYAMEIFIDQHSLRQAADYKRHCFESDSGEDTSSNDNYKIWQLKLCNAKNELLFNVKRGKGKEEWQNNMQESVDSLNSRDTLIYKFRRKEKKNTDLGDLTSVTEYRETQSSLRDKFIERYSVEGSVTGQAPSVLAISNKERRVTTSALENNTNNDHPSAYKIFTNTSKRTVASYNPDTSMFNYLKQLEDNDYRDNGKGNINISYTVCNQLINNFNAESTLENISEREHLIDLQQTYTPLQTSLPLWSKDSSSKFTLGEHGSFLDFGHTNVTPHFKFRTEGPKVTIMNEVLQSPWHPRQPNNYKPFRKVETVHFKTHPKNEANLSSTDNNNNRHTEHKMNIIVHDTLISSEHDLRCIVCQEVFTGRQELSNHMRRHSSVTRFSCKECEKTFSQLRNYKYHMSVHRGTKEFAATCSVCGKHFNDRGYLSNHMKIHRNRKEYKCASCPKSFNQRVAFNMHVRIHTGVKPHVCDECGKAFSRKMLLKQHQRTHTGERPYACAHCDKRFADRSNMTLHLRLHTGVKPFSCTLCSKSFTKKHHLKSHLNFHTGAKPYSCPQCKLTFTQSSNMRTHFKKCNAN